MKDNEIKENFAQVAGDMAELDNKVTELDAHVLMLAEALDSLLAMLTPKTWKATKKITEKINES